MRVTAVLAAVLIAVVLQIALARYAVGGRWVFDLVLVGVAFAALQGGAVAGMLAGTLGGLLQDVLSGGIVGVGGLAKTIVGCVVGVVGTQFVLVRPSGRMLIVAVATVFHRLIMVSLQALIDLQWFGISWGPMLVEVAINAGVALIVFQAANALPGALARQRMSRRSSLSRRQW
jgi:rod shape-determining protein MreD